MQRAWRSPPFPPTLAAPSPLSLQASLAINVVITPIVIAYVWWMLTRQDKPKDGKTEEMSMSAETSVGGDGAL